MAIQHEKGQERLSLEEFYALLERDPEHGYELIEGYPYMMTGGSPDHSIIGLNIGSIFKERLRKRPCIAYNSDVYVELEGEENCLCPDASISCDRRDRHATKVIRYPCVVAEVLSPGTRARDLDIKAVLYQNIPSVQAILFIDTQIMRIQHYQREEDHWIVRNVTQEGETIELTHIDIRFSVAEVYEKTTFDDTFVEEE